MAKFGDEIPGNTILNELCSSKGFGRCLGENMCPDEKFESICTVIDQISTSSDKILCLLSHEWTSAGMSMSLNITANRCSKMSEKQDRGLTLRSHRFVFFIWLTDRCR